MTPADYVRQIAALDRGAPDYLTEAEKVLHKALGDECCRMAALIDQLSLKNRIRFPSQAAEICREQSAFHLYYYE